MVLEASLVGYQWQSKVFAPYLNVWANTESTLTNASFSAGVIHFTIAFMVADSKGDPAFDGTIPLSTNFLVAKLADLRLYGGDIIISFGGASGES
jgi:chitinase